MSGESDENRYGAAGEEDECAGAAEEANGSPYVEKLLQAQQLTDLLTHVLEWLPDELSLAMATAVDATHREVGSSEQLWRRHLLRLHPACCQLIDSNCDPLLASYRTALALECTLPR